MSDSTSLTEARDVILKALNSTDGEVRAEAIQTFANMQFHAERGFTRGLIGIFAERPNGIYRILLSLLHPRWTNGGEEMMSSAPKFEEVKDDLMKGLRNASGDSAGIVPVLIGRYGPDAISVLPELIQRLRDNRTDCMIAPGLPWTVYQIGGMSDEVKAVLLEVAEKKGSCPHASPIAQEILTQNGVSWTEE